RRRHTRSKRDWSSDVCSSDLFGQLRRAEFAFGGQLPATADEQSAGDADDAGAGGDGQDGDDIRQGPGEPAGMRQDQSEYTEDGADRPQDDEVDPTVPQTDEQVEEDQGQQRGHGHRSDQTGDVRGEEDAGSLGGQPET